MKNRIVAERVGASLVLGAVVLASGCGDDAKPRAAATTSFATTTTVEETTTTSAPRKKPPRLVSPTYVTSKPVESSGNTTPDTTAAPSVGSPDTIPPNAVVTKSCASDDTALAETVITYAKASQPTVPVTVNAITHAPSDAAWARADVGSNTPGVEGFVAIVHCVGSQWQIVDAGTSGVGCGANVPDSVKAQISLECPPTS